MLILTDVLSSPFINGSINILQEFWRFCQSSEHHFPPCLHPELSTTWNDHIIVTYKFQYSWRVWTSLVHCRDCDSCMLLLLWHDIWRLRHLAAQLKLCGQLYQATIYQICRMFWFTHKSMGPKPGVLEAISAEILTQKNKKNSSHMYLRMSSNRYHGYASKLYRQNSEWAKLITIYWNTCTIFARITL